MAKKKTPAPRRAGTDVAGFERTIAAVGADLELLKRLIDTADRMIAARRSRRRRAKSTVGH